MPALIGTDYGRLLLAKLALFAAMLLLAMTNRWYLAIRLPSEDREAAAFASAQCDPRNHAAGIGVVTIVRALGVTVPAAHQVPVWPFEHTLSWRPVANSAWRQVILAAAGAIAIMSAGVALAGFRPGLIGAPLALRAVPRGEQFALGTARRAHAPMGCGSRRVSRRPSRLLTWLLAVPAHPRPMRRHRCLTTESIVRGGELYAQNCHGCHGPQGRGDGRRRPLSP